MEPVIGTNEPAISGGHQRLKILLEYCFEVDCVVVDMMKRKKKSNVALNKVSGDWNLPKLADLISELDEQCLI